MTGFQGMAGFDISYGFIRRAGMAENHPWYNIQMVTGLEGSIIECHPRDHCCPRPQAAGNNDPEGWHSIMLHSKPVTICILYDGWLYILFGRDGRIHGHKPLAFIIHLIWHGWANSRGQNYWLQQLTCWWCRLRHIWLLSMRETLLPCYDDLAVRNRL